MKKKLTPEEIQSLEYDNAHYDIDFAQVDWDALRDPFAGYYSTDSYVQILKAIRDPANFFFTCKYIFNIEPTVFQLVWLDELWNYSFPMLIAGRGASKSFTIGLYFALRSTITQGSKIVIAAPTFRQSKLVFDYIENIWNNAPVWRNLAGDNSGPSHVADMYTMRVGKSTINAIPLGTGEKIRGLRANYVDVEEFNSVNEEIFEIVLRGFTATSNNPVESIKREAKIKKLKDKGLLTKKLEEEIKGTHRANQIILSGTAGWDFQPFAKYWKRYRAIIKSAGDREKIKEATGSYPEEDFSHKDYCIIRMPSDLLPRGMMDATAIANARHTMDPARYDLEFGAIFSKDSNGFFPRTLIETCVTKEPVQLGNDRIQFGPRIRGDSACSYILALDPASEADNLAIVILENYNNHNRVVYCWTAQRKDIMKRFKDKDTEENNFYAFIARKIRTLMQTFNIRYIALDTQGGGAAVSEALHDLKRLEGGELPIWPICKEDPMFYPGTKDYGYDNEAGLHIIEMVNFSNAQYVMEANHGMRKDLMNKMLLFPYADAVTLQVAEIYDKSTNEEVDTLQNCIYELDQLKEEMSCIVHSTTLNGRDRWDTPQTIEPGGKKGRLRKDRYSAILMANMLARRLFRSSTIDYNNRAMGGFVDQFKGGDTGGVLYLGPEWYTAPANNSILGAGVNPGRKNDPFDYYKQGYRPY
jgi:hypothetical protein